MGIRIGSKDGPLVSSVSETVEQIQVIGRRDAAPTAAEAARYAKQIKIVF